MIFRMMMKAAKMDHSKAMSWKQQKGMTEYQSKSGIATGQRQHSTLDTFPEAHPYTPSLRKYCTFFQGIQTSQIKVYLLSQEQPSNPSQLQCCSFPVCTYEYHASNTDLHLQMNMWTASSSLSAVHFCTTAEQHHSSGQYQHPSFDTFPGTHDCTSSLYQCCTSLSGN